MGKLRRRRRQWRACARSWCVRGAPIAEIHVHSHIATTRVRAHNYRSISYFFLFSREGKKYKREMKTAKRKNFSAFHGISCSRRFSNLKWSLIFFIQCFFSFSTSLCVVRIRSAKIFFFLDFHTREWGRVFFSEENSIGHRQCWLWDV